MVAATSARSLLLKRSGSRESDHTAGAQGWDLTECVRACVNSPGPPSAAETTVDMSEHKSKCTPAQERERE